MGGEACVLTRTEGPVRIIVINRLEARNAVDGPTAGALRTAFLDFGADDRLHAGVPGHAVAGGCPVIEAEAVTGAARFAGGAGRHGRFHAHD